MPTPADESREPSRPALPLPDRPAIAVLPFTNMSGDPEQEYFSDGISEDIITALSKLRWFFVIARNSSFIYKGKAVHMKQVAEELGVGYVVEGSVRKGGDRVRITAQLNDVATGSHIWAERYDRDLADVFAVQDEITEAIVAAIEPQLYAAENFRAQAQAAGQHGRLGSGDAGAVALLAGDAAGQCGRAGAAREGDRHRSELRPGARRARHQPYVQRPYGLGGHGDGGADRRARRAGGDPGRQRGPLGALRLGLRLFVRAALRRFAGRVRAGAAAQSELLAGPGLLRPGAVLLRALGGGRRGRAQRALRLSPRDPFSAVYYGIAAYAQFVGRNYDEAMRLAREGIRQRGDFVGAHRVLTAAAGMAGQADVAKAALQELRRAQPNISLAWIANQMPIKQDAEREHYLEGFRRAGPALTPGPAPRHSPRRTLLRVRPIGVRRPVPPDGEGRLRSKDRCRTDNRPRLSRYACRRSAGGK